MNIPKISQIFSTYRTAGLPVQKNQGISVPTRPISDTFVLSNAEEKEIVKKIFSRTRKFSIKNYKKLNEKELEAMRTICTNDMFAKEAADINLDMALILKPELDKKYGEDNYVFVSIGRSPSGIARVFEFMGVETKYLPISGLRNYPDEDCVIGGAEGLREYGKFLKEQGITNIDIDFSDKKYLFFDYTYSGKSLDYFKKLIKRYYRVNQPNMEFISLNGELNNSVDDSSYKKRMVQEYIEEFLRSSHMQEFSGISELRVKNLFKINECKKFESDKAKKFNFLLIDELNRRHLLKDNPKNKKSL